jgi:F-type H+-transporting ATPase subunit b
MLPQPWIVLAEMINFLVLVALLQRFLYKPIMRAMALREQSIADRLDSAAVREADAQTLIDQYQQLQADWSVQTKARHHQLHHQLESERDIRLDQIRTELDTLRTQWYEALHQEQQTCLENLREHLRKQLMQTVRQALQDLASTTLEQQMVEAFLHRMQTLENADRQSLQTTIAYQHGPVHWTFSTTFPLSHTLKARLIEAVQIYLLPQSQAENFTFETHPEHPCGVELRTQGYKLAWHIEHYLDTLENQLNHALDSVTIL